jgi:hypothetical protein
MRKTNDIVGDIRGNYFQFGLIFIFNNQIEIL